MVCIVLSWISQYSIKMNYKWNVNKFYYFQAKTNNTYYLTTRHKIFLPKQPPKSRSTTFFRGGGGCAGLEGLRLSIKLHQRAKNFTRRNPHYIRNTNGAEDAVVL